MLKLPYPPDHRAVFSFWVALAILGGGATALLTGAVLARPWIGSLLALLLLVPAFASHETTKGIYYFWNRVAGWFGRRASAWVIWIAYYAIVVPVSRAGGDLPLARPGALPSQPGSMWVERKTLSPHAYAALFSVSTAESRRGWTAAYVDWSIRSRKPWALALLPLILLLRGLGASRPTAAADGIYTLY